MGLFDFFNKKKGDKSSSNNEPQKNVGSPKFEPKEKPWPRRTPTIPNWEKRYEQTLRKAYGLAGKQLDNYFKEQKNQGDRNFDTRYSLQRTNLRIGVECRRDRQVSLERRRKRGMRASHTGIWVE